MSDLPSLELEQSPSNIAERVRLPARRPPKVQPDPHALAPLIEMPPIELRPAARVVSIRR
jgi:hypothetical protein